MPVYILRAGDTEKVKIGWAEKNVQGRIAAIQAGHWEQFHILRTLPGCRLIESWLHRHFAEKRIARDWFLFDAEMMTIEPPSVVRIIASLPCSENEGGMEMIRARRGLMAKIASDLGITRAAVAMWDKVPGERLPAVEAATGIPRHKLRPDICLPPAAQVAA